MTVSIPRCGCHGNPATKSTGFSERKSSRSRKGSSLGEACPKARLRWTPAPSIVGRAAMTSATSRILGVGVGSAKVFAPGAPGRRFAGASGRIARLPSMSLASNGWGKVGGGRAGPEVIRSRRTRARHPRRKRNAADVSSRVTSAGAGRAGPRQGRARRERRQVRSPATWGRAAGRSASLQRLVQPSPCRSSRSATGSGT